MIQIIHISYFNTNYGKKPFDGISYKCYNQLFDLPDLVTDKKQGGQSLLFSCVYWKISAILLSEE